MMLYFADRRMNILGHASTVLPAGHTIQNDKRTSDIDTGVSAIQFDLPYRSDEYRAIKTMAREGNYLLRYSADRAEWQHYTIIETEDDSEAGKLNIYAEDAGLDLLNEWVGAFAATEAHPIAWYVAQFTDDSGFEIGINELSDRSRKLSWDGESTAAERVRSMARQFGGEVGYSFDIEGLRVVHKYIDLYITRGKNDGLELRAGREIGRIIEHRSIANLATALRAIGGIPEGAETQEPITLDDYSYDDGDMYLENGVMKCRSAAEIWSRHLSETGGGDGHIVAYAQFETTSQATLCSETITKLKSLITPEISYEAELLILPENLQLGDTVRIIDERGGRRVTVRLTKLTESESTKEYEAVFTLIQEAEEF